MPPQNYGFYLAPASISFNRQPPNLKKLGKLWKVDFHMIVHILMVDIVDAQFLIGDVAHLSSPWLKCSKWELAYTMKKIVGSKRPGVSRWGYSDA